MKNLLDNGALLALGVAGIAAIAGRVASGSFSKRWRTHPWADLTKAEKVMRILEREIGGGRIEFETVLPDGTEYAKITVLDRDLSDAGFIMVDRGVAKVPRSVQMAYGHGVAGPRGKIESDYIKWLMSFCDEANSNELSEPTIVFRASGNGGRSHSGSRSYPAR